MSALKLITVILAMLAVALSQESLEMSDQFDGQTRAQLVNLLRLLLRENELERGNESEERQLRNAGPHEKKTLCHIDHSPVIYGDNYYEEVTCNKQTNVTDFHINKSHYCYTRGNDCRYSTEKRTHNGVDVFVPVGCICTPIPENTYVVGRNFRSLN